MSIESKVQDEKQKQLKTEAERKEEIKKTLIFNKEKNELTATLGKRKELAFLKSLVERWLVGYHAAEIIAASESISTEEIEAIFEKIDAIEGVPEIERILSKNFRLTKEEYADALADMIKRKTALQKIEAALTHLYEMSNPNGFSVTLGVFFSGFMVLNTHLVMVQENTIDIKRSLIL